MIIKGDGAERLPNEILQIQTNPAVIEHIFSTMNSKWKTSGIRHAPGEQKRGDRWQLYLECDDRKSIPEGFVLSKMGPEGQDIRVKIFVSGRQISEEEQTTEKSQSKPPQTPRPTTTPTLHSALLNSPCRTFLPSNSALTLCSPSSPTCCRSLLTAEFVWPPLNCSMS